MGSITMSDDSKDKRNTFIGRESVDDEWKTYSPNFTITFPRRQSRLNHKQPQLIIHPSVTVGETLAKTDIILVSALDTTLTLNNLTISITKQHSTTKHLFKLSTGTTLSLSHIRILFTLPNALKETPAVTVRRGTISSVDVEWSGVKRESGDASIIEETIEASQSFSLSNMKSTSCSLSSSSSPADDISNHHHLSLDTNNHP